MPNTVLVLDAMQRAALAVTRSLGRAGVAVMTADCSPEALAGHSRYSIGYAQSPDPAQAPADWLHWLEQLCQSEAIDLVFPVTEITSQLILDGAPGRKFRIPFAGLETVMALADKGDLVERALRLGIPVPATQRFEKGLQCTPETVASWPAVLKPTRSRRWLGDRWLCSNVHIVHNADELERTIGSHDYLRDYPLLLQEYIPGHGAGLFALYDQGQAKAFFSHRRLREKPPSGGVSVLSESQPLETRQLEAGRKLLDNVHWHGVAMVEYRVGNDGTPYLMEVNTRFWGSLQLAIDAGIDFPYWLYQGETGDAAQSANAITRYRQTRLRWLLGDLDNLYLQLKSRRLNLSAKLAAVLRFLQPWPGARHEVNRWHDLRPAWLELKQWIRGGP